MSLVQTDSSQPNANKIQRNIKEEEKLKTETLISIPLNTIRYDVRWLNKNPNERIL